MQNSRKHFESRKKEKMELKFQTKHNSVVKILQRSAGRKNSLWNWIQKLALLKDFQHRISRKYSFHISCTGAEQKPPTQPQQVSMFSFNTFRNHSFPYFQSDISALSSWGISARQLPWALQLRGNMGLNYKKCDEWQFVIFQSLEVRMFKKFQETTTSG